jgi:hypothetical protein
MIDLLKNKYELVSHQQISPIANNYLTQFLNMGMIYKVEPKALDDKGVKSKILRRGNVVNGNAGLMVDEVDDEDNDGMMDDMDEEDEYNESISNLLAARFQQGNRNERSENNDEAYLSPLERLPQNVHQAELLQQLSSESNHV